MGDGGTDGGPASANVDFGALSGALERHEYPTTNEALLDALGDRELAVAGETRTLASVLGPERGVTYDSADEVRRAVANVVAAEPVGRRRDGPGGRRRTGRRG